MQCLRFSVSVNIRGGSRHLGMTGSTVWSGDAEAQGCICPFPRDPPEPVQGEPDTEHICVLPANTSVHLESQGGSMAFHNRC